MFNNVPFAIRAYGPDQVKQFPGENPAFALDIHYKCLSHIQTLLNDDELFSNAMNECNKIGENTTNLLLRDIHFWPYHNITPLSTITETTRNILNWMITSKFPMNSVPAFFMLVPDISKKELAELISLGFNPIVARYNDIKNTSVTDAIENHKKDYAKYGSIYTKFDENLWFSFKDTEDPNGNILKKFTPFQGIRIPEDNNIGQGGYSRVS